jgi:Ca2+-binding RTX toxin-like protein
VLYNSGTIRNDSYGTNTAETVAIRGGLGDDAITNAGYVRGTIQLQEGNDLYDGRIGRLDGTVHLGNGNDTLIGGAGQDIFVFNAKLGTDKTDRKANLDTIVSFSVADDTIWLDNAIFKTIGRGSASKPGKLNKAFFKISDKAKDANDYILYNRKTGFLSFDQDGNGTKYKAIEFAKLDANLKLTAADFMII